MCKEGTEEWGREREREEREGGEEERKEGVRVGGSEVKQIQCTHTHTLDFKHNYDGIHAQRSTNHNTIMMSFLLPVSAPTQLFS